MVAVVAEEAMEDLVGDLVGDTEAIAANYP